MSVVMLVMLVGVVGVFSGCNRNRIVYTDYFRVQLRRSEGYAVVLELTELGREQEILAIPMFVEGLPVRRIGGGSRGMWTGAYAVESLVLEKIYIPYSVDKTAFVGVSNGKIILTITQPSESLINSFRTINFYGGGGTLVYIHENSILNTFFMYNFQSAPNKGYYWVDYINGSNLYLYPPNPIRQGYIFTGWHLEPQGANEWNNQMPKSADDTLRLYAKWQSIN